MGIRLRYVAELGAEEDVFLARLDDRIVLITAQLRRTDASGLVTPIIPAWLDVRGRRPPAAYERDVFAMYPAGEGTFRIPGFAWSRGDREDLWLTDVPLEVSQRW